MLAAWPVQTNSISLRGLPVSRPIIPTFSCRPPLIDRIKSTPIPVHGVGPPSARSATPRRMHAAHSYDAQSGVRIRYDRSNSRSCIAWRALHGSSVATFAPLKNLSKTINMQVRISSESSLLEVVTTAKRVLLPFTCHWYVKRADEFFHVFLASMPKINIFSVKRGAADDVTQW